MGAGGAPNSMRHEQLAEGRGHHRGEIAASKRRGPDVALDLRAEHPQAEHIEQQVREVARYYAGTHK